MKIKISLFIVASINILLRLIYVFYGYIPSEEGMLVYGQKFAYSGMMPFIDYNAWNSLLNNYLVGFYQFFISPTILTQRLFGLILSMIVMLFVAYTANIMEDRRASLLAIIIITFGSLTYVYYSTVPYSTQTMTAMLICSITLLAKTVRSGKNNLLLFSFSTILGVISIITRPQAIPAFLFIWLYIMYRLRFNKKHMLFITITGILTTIIIYLPFLIKSVDHTIYSVLWPFKAHEILVYQAGYKTISISDWINFIINVFREYNILIAITISTSLYAIALLYRSKVNMRQTDIFLFFILFVGIGIAGVSILHKPPYSTYIYPAVPFFVLFSGVHMSRIGKYFTEKLKFPAQMFMYVFFTFVFLSNFILFPHVDYLKTSLADIKQPTLVSLSSITQYIESKTDPGSEILAFYLPSVVGLNREIPKNLNEGEGSLSILPKELSTKYHLTNIEQLVEYIQSRKATAIVMTGVTQNFFGTNRKERESVLSAIDQNYYIDMTFDNFSTIGNPKAGNLYFYLLR